MSKDDDEKTRAEKAEENRGDDQEQKMTEAPEITDEHKEKAAEMMKSYDDQRPTAVMPGSDGTITGTAVNEWLDDDGNPKFADDAAKEDAAKEDAPKEDAPKEDS
ncbi:hypothetical protein [Mycobacterium kyorinense]|nr:hypothetical protein [Mycobacterium kyorinense]